MSFEWRWFLSGYRRYVVRHRRLKERLLKEAEVSIRLSPVRGSPLVVGLIVSLAARVSIRLSPVRGSPLFWRYALEDPKFEFLSGYRRYVVRHSPSAVRDPPGPFLSGYRRYVVRHYRRTSSRRSGERWFLSGYRRYVVRHPTASEGGLTRDDAGAAHTLGVEGAVGLLAAGKKVRLCWSGVVHT